jgi:hypothetical protein
VLVDDKCAFDLFRSQNTSTHDLREIKRSKQKPRFRLVFWEYW